MIDTADALLYLPELTRTTIRVTGRDRLTVLHNLCTQNIRALTVGSGCEAFITSVQGKTLGHGLFYCDLDAVMIITSPGQANALIQHMDKYVIREEVQFEDLSHTAVYSLAAGSLAEGAVAAVTGMSFGESDMAHVTADVGGTTVIARRCPLLPGGLLLQSPTSTDRWPRQPGTLGDAVILDPSAFTWRRILHGWPEYAIDIDERNLPQEVARDAATISFTKGCYLGQETVARLDALGHVNQVLCGLRSVSRSATSSNRLPSDFTPPVPTGTSLRCGDTVAGRITSSAWGEDQNVYALGYVKRAHAQPGTEVESDLGPFRVSTLPMTPLAVE